MSSESESPEETEHQKIHALVKGLEVSQKAQQQALIELKEHVRQQERKKSAAKKRAKSYVDLSRDLRQQSAHLDRKNSLMDKKLSEQNAKYLKLEKKVTQTAQTLEKERDKVVKELERTKKLLAHQKDLKTEALTAKRALESDLDYARKCFIRAESKRERQTAQSFIAALDHPYPYQSMMAISSDIDDASFASFSLAHRCFYGQEPGYEGVELELSNSYWLACTDEPKTSDIYLYNENLKPAAHHDKLLPFLKTSLFDSLHTYGQFGEPRRFSREIAEFCVDKLQAHNLKPEFWTYHGDRKQFQNGVPTDDVWRADDKESPYYHFDLLKNTSLRYLRLPPSRRFDQVHSVLEKQNFRDGSPWYVVNSHSITVDKEASLRATKWLDKLEGMDKLNYERRRVIQPSTLYPHKIQTWMPEMLPEQLSVKRLDAIVEQGQHLLVTQHLTKAFSDSAYSLKPVQQALHRLSAYQKAKKILVTTPVKLINFERVREGLSHEFKILKSVKRLDINLDSKCDLYGIKTKILNDDLQGIGFKISKDLPSDYDIQLTLDKKTVTGFKIHEIKATGERIIYLPWRSNLEAQKDRIKEWDKTFTEPS